MAHTVSQSEKVNVSALRKRRELVWESASQIVALKKGKEKEYPVAMKVYLVRLYSSSDILPRLDKGRNVRSYDILKGNKPRL